MGEYQLKDRLNNIFILAVTIFLISCGVNSKLDQNLAELQTMNKNMEQMNKNMAEGVKNFNDVGQSVKALSDESVSFLKKTDPQQFFDMFNQISDKFESMLAGLMDQTGDIKGFVDKANRATQLFLDYSQQLTPPELGEVKDSLNKIAGMTTQINELLAKSGNYEAMANQVLLTTQMFTAVGLSLGENLNTVSNKDATAMMGIMDANMKNMQMMGSTKKLSDQMNVIAKRMVKEGKNSKLHVFVNDLTSKMMPMIQKWDGLITDKSASFEKKWDKMDSDYRTMLCFAMSALLEFSKAESPLGLKDPLTKEQKENIQKQYDKMQQVCKQL
jgi:uncharacterized protein YukE